VSTSSQLTQAAYATAFGQLSIGLSGGDPRLSMAISGSATSSVRWRKKPPFREFAEWEKANHVRRFIVASTRQVAAAKENVKKAQRAARKKRTIANLPADTRHDLGRQAARSRQRGGGAGHALEDRNRQQLYELAKKRNIRGRSKMGKWDLIEALRGSS
jgi:hypothetical protein